MKLKPSEIFYSQDSVSNTFDQRSSHAGKRIGETLDDLCEGRCSIFNIPTITVVQSSGKWITHDNRRLWVFRHLERLGKCDEIPVYVSSSIPMAKLTSFNGGKDINVRRNPGGNWQYKPSKARETPKRFTPDRKVYDSSTPMPKTLTPPRQFDNSSNQEFGFIRETSMTKKDTNDGVMYGLQRTASQRVDTANSNMPIPKTKTPPRQFNNSSYHENQEFEFIRETCMTNKDTNDGVMYGSQRNCQRLDTINSIEPTVYYGSDTRNSQTTTQSLRNFDTQRQDTPGRNADYILQLPNKQFKQSYGKSHSPMQSNSLYQGKTEPSSSKVDCYDKLSSKHLHAPTAKPVDSKPAQCETSSNDSRKSRTSTINVQTVVDIEESEQRHPSSTGFFDGVMKLCIIL